MNSTRRALGLLLAGLTATAALKLIALPGLERDAMRAALSTAVALPLCRAVGGQAAADYRSRTGQRIDKIFVPATDG